MSRLQKQNLNTPVTPWNAWPVVLWLVVFGGVLFFWPACLDRYLAPRFFYLSAALILSVFLLRKDLAAPKASGLRMFDLLLLGWYGINLISITWSLSWSEGIFYAQKALLLFAVYWLFRQALERDEAGTYRTMGVISTWLTAIICALLIVQIGMAARQKGLDNDSLYDFASGLSGNKSLAGETLFFLLVFNVLFPSSWPRFRWVLIGLLLALLLVLQVRTALLATIAGGLVYGVGRALTEPAFRPLLLRKILPAGLVVLGMLAAFVAWKGMDSPIVQRLNPLHYGNSDTANERKFVWYKTDLLNADHFWLGVGNGSWKFWLPSKNIEGGYRMSEENVIFTRAHNDYLEIRAEMGIPGVLWFCALFGIAFLGALLSFKNQKLTHPQRQTVLLAGIGLMGYCIIQYFDFPRERIDFQVFLGLLFAALAHLSPFQKEIKGPALLRVLLLAGLFFNLLIGSRRMNGEIHLVKMLEAQKRSNWQKLIAESTLAENSFFQYTDTATPIAWHEGLGWFQLQQYDKSLSAFERAYRLDPWSFQVINNYASALVKLERYQEAIPLYEKALGINPRYDEGKFNLSFVYMQLADYGRAEEWLNKVDTIRNPTNDIDRNKNRQTLKQLGDYRLVLKEKRH